MMPHIMLSSRTAIILVRPQMGENIGATARAMKNFGLHDLRLVAPRDGWPNERAVAMASHAYDIIDAATLYNTLDDALHDCHRAYAATARPRELSLSCYTPHQAAQDVASYSQTAYVFGPENNGLSNEDIASCHGIITIPTDNYSSLNLAQSVVILGYELFGRTADASSSIKNVASHAEIDALFSKLNESLQQSRYYPDDARAEMMHRHVKQLLLQSNLSSQQCQTFHGIIRALMRGSKDNRS